MKAVLISIKPKWCDLIRRGRKTVEVRKTCPKLEVPFKVYIYETMDGGRGSGLVFGEFVCIGFDVFRPIGKGISIKRFPALYESCLTLDEIVKYAQGEPVYGWQISQLKLYEEPLKLEDFSRHGFCGMNGTGVCGNVVRWLPPVSQDRSSRADFKIGHGGFTEADFYPPIVGKDRLFESRFETSRGTYLPPVIEGVYPDTVQTATMAHEGVRGAVYHTHLKPRRID